MVYESSNEQSFKDIKGFWQNEVEQYSEKNIGILLLGNKKDLDESAVSRQMA